LFAISSLLCRTRFVCKWPHLTLSTNMPLFSIGSFRWAIPLGSDDDNGGGGGDGDDWYLGSVPSFRPNVAYSLYGILQGEKDRGCSKKTYINSFYTTQGVESFTNAMAAAGLSDRFTYIDGDDEQDNEENGGGGSGDPTSTCYQVDNDSNDNNQEEEADEAVDDAGGGERRRRRRLNNEYKYVNGAKYDSYASSYGLGCTDRSLSKQPPTFAIQSYSGDYCDANAIVATKDDLQDFNYRLSETTCVRIYSQGDSGYGGDDDESQDSGDSSSPLALLASSKSCKIYDGSGTCPDPFGKLKRYESKLYQATGIQGMQSWMTIRQVYIASWTMIGVGILAFVIGLCMCIKKCCKRRRRFAVFRRSSQTSRAAHRASRRSFISGIHSSNSFSSASTTTNKASSSGSRASKSGSRIGGRKSNRRSKKGTGIKRLPFFR
jgi:hypothetical protein